MKYDFGYENILLRRGRDSNPRYGVVPRTCDFQSHPFVHSGTPPKLKPNFNVIYKKNKASSISVRRPNLVFFYSLIKFSDMEKKLKELREEIDKVDERIIELLKRRLQLAQEIGKIKEGRGLQAFDLSREKQVIRRVLELNQGVIPEDTLKLIYSEIIRACRASQERPKVAFLGPEATFSHIAAQHYFGTSAHFIPVETIVDVFEEVASERAHFGVVPIENSIEGVVATTLDAIYEYGLKVCGEIYEAISHHLMNQTGRLEDIKKILSHPQAIAQCRKWLRKKLPSVPVEAVSSTALAAKWAAVDESVGAIASLLAAKLYHLQIVAKNIEDIRGNSTRFWIIGKVEMPPTGEDKTSLIFSVADRPGALYQVLKCFADRQINLTKIESRPSKDEPWKYIFFLDCEGHIKDPIVEECFSEMQKYCIQVVWLGSYPRGKPL